MRSRLHDTRTEAYGCQRQARGEADNAPFHLHLIEPVAMNLWCV